MISNQQQLLLLDDVRGEPVSLFLAIVLSQETRAKVELVERQLRVKYRFKGIRPVGHFLHMTLHHLGDYDAELIPREVLEAADRSGLAADRSGLAAAATFSPFVATLDQALSYRGGREKPIVLRGSDCNKMILEIHGHLRKLLWMESCVAKYITSSKLDPHVTLFRDAMQMDEQPIDPILFAVDEIVLLQSFLGQSYHRKLKSWALRGGLGATLK